MKVHGLINVIKTYLTRASFVAAAEFVLFLYEKEQLQKLAGHMEFMKIVHMGVNNPHLKANKAGGYFTHPHHGAAPIAAAMCPHHSDATPCCFHLHQHRSSALLEPPHHQQHNSNGSTVAVVHSGVDCCDGLLQHHSRKNSAAKKNNNNSRRTSSSAAPLPDRVASLSVAVDEAVHVMDDSLTAELLPSSAGQGGGGGGGGGKL